MSRAYNEARVAIKKAVRLEVLIMTCGEHTDTEILRDVHEALLRAGEITSVVVKIKEKHERILALDSGEEAIA